MQVSEVRIQLMANRPQKDGKLLAFASITLDDSFVVRDLKIIAGADGDFVAMPSRKLTDRCNHCSTKNHMRSRFCNQCGARLDEGRAPLDAGGRAKLNADVAHPINSRCRLYIQSVVMAAYDDELEMSRQPGYVPRYDPIDEIEARHAG